MSEKNCAAHFLRLRTAEAPGGHPTHLTEMARRAIDPPEELVLVPP